MALVNGFPTGIANLAASATAQAQAALDRQSSLLVSETHGKYWAAARNGCLFMATTVIAGVVLPVAAATLNSKFTLHNPAGSGVVVEPLYFSTGLDTATQVVNGMGFLIQRSLSVNAGIPTTTTAAANIVLGASSTGPKAAVYTQATLTNVAIPGVSAATAVPIGFYNMFSSGATTAAGIYECGHSFDGKIALNPDDLMAACTTVAAAAQNFCGIIWAEWPV
jgi:hypothetical protein